MHAVEGGVASRLTGSRQVGRDASGIEVYRALVTTLRLLARRLDALLQETLPDGDRLAVARTRALADDVVESLHRLVDTPDLVLTRRPRRATAFRRLADDFSRATGACVEVRATGQLDTLADDVVAVLFGVACEVFLHLERHGRATVVLVTIDVDDDQAVLDVRDDGLDLALREAYDFATETRTGLVAAAHLVRSAGGRMAVAPTSPRGIRLVAVVPRR